MAQVTKRSKKWGELFDRDKTYGLKDAISVLKKAPKVKFDETVEVSIKLSLNPKDSTQAVRGTITLPHGTGKTVRIAVFCKGENETKATAGGAEFVGSDDLIKKVQGGWCDFDVAIATPDMMRDIARLGKILGPRGLMPSPKAGTVTQDIEKTIKEVKAGKIEFKMDKQAGIHAPVGKLSFEEDALYANALALIDSIMGSNPSGVRGQHVKSLYVSASMGPGIKLDLSEFRKA
ncbi:50S ribosomal protein L1 [Candidatus Omnitrophota bacterium]